MAIGSGSVAGLGAALRTRLKRRLEIGLVLAGGSVSGPVPVVANSVANLAECDSTKYLVNSLMDWYSKNSVLESEPNVCSIWFVSLIARIESIPYFSSAACGSI